MLSAKELSELIHTVYAASADEELWPQVLRDLGRLLQLTGASLIHHDVECQRYDVDFTWGNDEWKPGYRAHYGALDIWRPNFMDKKVGEFALGSELCPRRAALETEFYQDYARKFDLDLFGAVATVKHPGRFEALSLYQGWKEQKAAAFSVETLNLLFPHLQAALSLRRRFLDLRAYVGSLESAFDRAATAIVLLDQESRVVRMNATADALLSAHRGLWLDRGVLRASTSADQLCLTRLVRRISAGLRRGTMCPGGSMLVKRPQRRPLVLAVAPMFEPTFRSSPSATVIVFIYDPDSNVRPPMDLLREGYGLTKAEAFVAWLLVEGKSLTEVAEHRAVTYNTIKQQMKSIYLKTATGHQAELIRLLMRCLLTSEAHSDLASRVAKGK